MLKDNKKNFDTQYKNLTELWDKFFNIKYKEYKKILRDYEVDYLENVQKEVINLNIDIKSLEVELRNLPEVKKEIEENEKLIIKLGRKIYDLTLKIESKRKKKIKKIQKKLRDLEIDIKIRLKAVKRSKQYKTLLKQIHDTKLEDVINQIEDDFLPFQLGESIINEKISDYSQKFDKQKRKIFEKLNDLITNPNYPKIYDGNLIEFFKIYLDRRPIISFKRKKSNKYLPLKSLSIGERCAVLLYIMLLVKNKPLLVDQADSELDQESIQKFSKYLLDIKSNRQIIVATHNPNIPTLGDVDLLYHLDTFPSENREIGKILNSGGFEDCIDSILELEGGGEAIERRFKKYNKKFF